MASPPGPDDSPRPGIATPCVKLCVVDGASSLCLGCWRTLSEIGGWSGFTDEERAAIMAALPAREARAKGGGAQVLGRSRPSQDPGPKP